MINSFSGPAGAGPKGGFMTIARQDIIAEGAEGIYHCISRCVRRAFLCGEDAYTGRSYEHRKAWIRSRLRELSAAFGLEVGGYAVMSNHLHVILRTRPDQVAQWSDTEVARRWLSVFPPSRDAAGHPSGPGEEAVRVLAGNTERIRELRRRLASVSWFMRCLNEHIARRANREDQCKGRFWEGRFKCQVLLDEGAVLACLAYVDLNPIRSGVTDRPETSEFTSAYDRIMAGQARRDLVQASGSERDQDTGTRVVSDQARASVEADRWLCPLNDGPQVRSEALLALSTDEYLEVLDWTGRQLRGDKKGAIPADLQPILERVQVRSEHWLETVDGYGRLFHRVSGKVESILAAARQAGKRWLGGIRAGRTAFGTA